jgi:hypothetical protein
MAFFLSECHTASRQTRKYDFIHAHLEILNPCELIFTKLANAKQHHMLGTIAKFCTWAARIEMCSRPTVKYDFHTTCVYEPTVIKKVVDVSHTDFFQSR